MRNSLLTCLVRATLARKRFHALEIWHNVYPGVGRVREYFTAKIRTLISLCSVYCKTLSKRINSEEMLE
jgi:hypothetical protein